MSDHGRDPSPLRGPWPARDPERVRASLRDRLRRAEYADLGLPWGFALCGEPQGEAHAGTYGHLLIVTLHDAVALTPALVRASRGMSLYLLSCARTTLSVPSCCEEMGWADHSPLPAVAFRSVWGCQPRGGIIGGGVLEGIVEYDHASRTPVAFLTPYPIPGWPR